MPSYVRPVGPDQVFRDRAGAVIHYGSRWDGSGPPTDTYSVVSHAERFAPLHLVADALIEHLAETYDVQVSQDASHADDFLRHPDLERVTRLSPNDSAAAPLTFGFTTYPGLILHAGLLHDFAYPICGSDACDETATNQVEHLEGHVSAVVTGRYRESYTPGAELPLEFALRFDDGGQAGSTTTDGYPAGLLANRRSATSRIAGWVGPLAPDAVIHAGRARETPRPVSYPGHSVQDLRRPGPADLHSGTLAPLANPVTDG
jgi:hypothetical protein